MGHGSGAGGDEYSDIEEALTELFEAEEILQGMGECERVLQLRAKIGRAHRLLDRPWP